MKRITFRARRTSFMTALMRSSNCPRYFVPATIIARSRITIRRPVQDLRHLVTDDLLGEPLDDRGFTHAGFAEQNRIVLHSAAQHGDDPLDFLGAANDRIELAVAGEHGQVASE